MHRLPELLLLHRSSPSSKGSPSQQGLLGPSASSSSSLSSTTGLQPRARRHRGVPIAVGAAALLALSPVVLMVVVPLLGDDLRGWRNNSSTAPQRPPPIQKMSSEWVDHFVAVFPGSAPAIAQSNHIHPEKQRQLPNHKIFVTGPWVPKHFLSDRRFRPRTTTSVAAVATENSRPNSEDGSSRSDAPPPLLLELHHFNNTAMAESVRLIDRELRQVAGVHGAWEAWIALRPWAYRADLWRYLILWSEGGVYVDAKLRLRVPLDVWASLSPLEALATCHDHDRTHQSSLHPTDPPLRVLWNGAVSAPPKSPILLEAIKLCISNVQNRAYVLPYFAPKDVGIHGDLAVTGPLVLSLAARRVAGYGGLAPSNDVTHHSRNNNSSSAVRVSCAYRDAGNGFLEEPSLDPPHHHQGILVFDRDSSEHERVRSTDLNYGQLYMIHAVYCDEPLPENRPDPACAGFAAAAAQAAASRATGAASSEPARPSGMA